MANTVTHERLIEMAMEGFVSAKDAHGLDHMPSAQTVWEFLRQTDAEDADDTADIADYAGDYAGEMPRAFRAYYNDYVREAREAVATQCDLCDAPTSNMPSACCGSTTCDKCKIHGCFCSATDPDESGDAI